MDEAFIGVVSRISRRVAASATISRTIDVYLTLVQKHLNMKVLDWHQEVVWAEKMQKCFWTMVLWVLLFFDQNPQLVREFRTRTRITRRTPKRARIVLKVFFFWLGLLFLSLWPSWYIYIIKTHHMMMLNTIGFIFYYLESFLEWIGWQRSIGCLIMTHVFRCKPRQAKM